MPVQTTVRVKPYNFYDGQIANMTPGKDGHKIVETAAIPFGRVVSIGSADTNIVIGGTNIAGITTRGLEFVGTTAPVGQPVGIRTDGPVACLVNGAGSANDVLNYDQTTGELTTAAVAGDVVAFSVGQVTLALDKIDETDDNDNIVMVNVSNIA